MLRLLRLRGPSSHYSSHGFLQPLKLLTPRDDDHYCKILRQTHEQINCSAFITELQTTTMSMLHCDSCHAGGVNIITKLRHLKSFSIVALIVASKSRWLMNHSYASYSFVFKHQQHRFPAIVLLMPTTCRFLIIWYTKRKILNLRCHSPLETCMLLLLFIDGVP